MANLGHLSDSSVCYEPTYRDYRYLDADIVILYEGYNDVEGPSRRTERDCYQQGSLIFRWTGFFPIAPLFLREHWYRVRYGSITKGYEVARETQLAARSAAAGDGPPISAYENYERNVLSFVRRRLDEGKGVVFASQPYIGNPAHLDQQKRIRAALEPLMSNPAISLSRLPVPVRREMGCGLVQRADVAESSRKPDSRGEDVRAGD